MDLRRTRTAPLPAFDAVNFDVKSEKTRSHTAYSSVIFMSKEEEEEMDRLAQARRSQRSTAFYTPYRMAQNPLLDSDCSSSGATDPVDELIIDDNFSVYSNSENESVQYASVNSFHIKRPSCRFPLGYSETKGRRDTMEDSLIICGQFNDERDQDLLCVFDGHNGRAAANFAASKLPDLILQKIKTCSDEDIPQLLKDAFIEVQKEMELNKEEIQNSGTTALVSFIKGDTIYIANCGDCRAVLAEDGIATRCSVDHKPDLPSEKERIEKSGGSVTNINNTARINGCLSVARSLGDFSFQSCGLSPIPEVLKFPIRSEVSKVSLILGCDGLWDKISDQEAVLFVAQSKSSHPLSIAKSLRDLAYNKGSSDNITVAYVSLK